MQSKKRQFVKAIKRENEKILFGHLVNFDDPSVRQALSELLNGRVDSEFYKTFVETDEELYEEGRVDGSKLLAEKEIVNNVIAENFSNRVFTNNIHKLLMGFVASTGVAVSAAFLAKYGWCKDSALASALALLNVPIGGFIPFIKHYDGANMNKARVSAAWDYIHLRSSEIRGHLEREESADAVQAKNLEERSK